MQLPATASASACPPRWAAAWAAGSAPPPRPDGCATWRRGRSPAEIYAVQKDIGQSVSHIVLMGIGEPLDNLRQRCWIFCHIISCPEGVNIGMRNISLSTCGLVPMIDTSGAEKAAAHPFHLPARTQQRDAQRDDAGERRLPGGTAASRPAAAYQKTTGRRISFEYSMVRGVNDSPDTARELAAADPGHGGPCEPDPHQPGGRQPLHRHRCRRTCSRFQALLTELGGERHGAPAAGQRYQRGLRPAAPGGSSPAGRRNFPAKTIKESL